MEDAGKRVVGKVLQLPRMRSQFRHLPLGPRGPASSKRLMNDVSLARAIRILPDLLLMPLDQFLGYLLESVYRKESVSSDRDPGP